MMEILFLSALAVFIVSARSESGVPNSGEPPTCRFAPLYFERSVAPLYGQTGILDDPEPLISDMLYWEGRFARPGIGHNTANGMTYDGTLLNFTTGLELPNRAGLHNFSAASKEALHVMVLAHGLAAHPAAARFLSPAAVEQTPDIAFALMKQKLETYLAFNASYPGFGGYLPWYNNTFADIEPTNDWVDRVPALDNGELVWAVYAAVEVLSSSSRDDFQDLGRQWQVWLDYTKDHAAEIFYRGDGIVCAVTALNQTLFPNDVSQNYTCEGTGVLDDPYEGELFAWWLYFFGGLSPSEKEAIWTAKRPKLESVEYQMGDTGPITVQKGFWFSSHEQWKVLEMPYHDIEIVKRVYTNAERARTCNSVAKGIPGMYASVNNVTNVTTGEIIGYISNAGIPSISNQTEQELDVITPYAVFPTLMVEGKIGRAVGMAWWWNMVMGKKIQNPYGSTESERTDGTAVSSFVSWDSKITTVVALFGGVGDLVRDKMMRDGIYEEFLEVTQVSMKPEVFCGLALTLSSGNMAVFSLS